METKVGPSRREVKIAELRKEKKRLRTRWAQASGNEREGFKALYDEVK